MEVLKELEYYCDEKQPAGALMFTGEWGCGKTYLLTNILPKKLKTKCIFIRVSLFGMESIEEVKQEVKKQWFRSVAELTVPVSGFSKKLQNFSKIFKSLGDKCVEYLPTSWRHLVSGALSINLLDFINVEPTFGDKKIILIFDDLERASLSTTDLLGCINDYCENLHFNTIVVANEEKIQSSENEKMKYAVLKEKIIQRTIQYKPNYFLVVSNVIDNIQIDDNDYKKFLKEQKNTISTLFSYDLTVEDDSVGNEKSDEYSALFKNDGENTSTKAKKTFIKNSHNIRSLKCGIQDFKRIYDFLNAKKIDNKEKWFSAFISYLLCYRAGLVVEKYQYGILYDDDNVSKLYPGFYDSNFIINGIKKWIKESEWSEDTLCAEFEDNLNRNKENLPEEKVRNNLLFDLEENDINAGYSKLLDKAYKGELEHNDYVNIIHNNFLARTNGIVLPSIDWEKIDEGIDIYINKQIETNAEKPTNRIIMDDNNLNAEERRAYQKIKDFREFNIVLYAQSKLFYINNIEKNPLGTLYEINNKSFNIFDESMANATINAFTKLDNKQKHQFSDTFTHLWDLKIQSTYFDCKQSLIGFEKLGNLLKDFIKECENEHFGIAKINTKIFLENVEKLIADLNNTEQ